MFLNMMKIKIYFPKKMVNDAVVSELTYTYDSAIQWAKNTLEVKNERMVKRYL